MGRFIFVLTGYNFIKEFHSNIVVVLVFTDNFYHCEVRFYYRNTNNFYFQFIKVSGQENEVNRWSV